MTTTLKRASNARNARRSTGPRTEAGRARSAQNARKHGLYARAPVVPGGETRAFNDWLAGWVDYHQPEGPAETDALGRAAYASWELKGCAAVRAAATEKRRRHAGRRYDRDQADRADALGTRLFSVADDLLSPPRGAPFGYQMADPRPLYRELTSFAQGADWLLAGWRALLALLETETRWGDHDRLRATLLLGKRPGDALADPELTRLFLACHACDDRSCTAAEYFYRAGAAGHPRPYYDDLLKAVLAGRPATADAGRAVLRALAHEQIARLEALKAEELDELNELDREAAVTCARFDDSKEGAALRRQESALERDLHRALADLVKLQKHAGRAPCADCGNEPISEVEDIEEFASDDPFEIGENASDAPIAPVSVPAPPAPAVAVAPAPVEPVLVDPAPPSPAAPAALPAPPAASCGNEPIAEIIAVTPVMPDVPAPSAPPVSAPLGVRCVDGAERDPMTDVIFRHGRRLG
jgi:hypothetical protein